MSARTSDLGIAGAVPDVAAPRGGRLAGRGTALAALLIFLVLAVLPPVAVAVDDPFLVVTATRIIVFAIAALSLDLVLGYGAMVSFGHAAFLGLGAYAVAILSSHGISDILVQGVVAVAASALFALVTGAISLRTKGVYFIMITLAFGQMAYFFMVSLSAYGGDDGLTLAGRSTLFGLPILRSDHALFYLSLGVLAAAFVGLRALTLSRFGRVLRGTKENPVRMQAIGFQPFAFQLTAYVIAGALAGLAGVLLANQAEFVSPAYMSWQRSGELIVMVVLGGMGTLVGAIGGAIALLLLEDWLAHFSEHWKLGLGVFLVLLVLFTRGGIVGGVERLFGRTRP
ncbi:branched-chain amino acid ABC transporter permease [Aurantimonas sp. 22II-16-19i]|uniref:branched-chain amino acid ABC transporter permease n=1 Tax=Aurantimonas sp. 22II-16-19i TaxID=1317114 RepID=UPI0009F7B9DB|nr:branched-chain amino acid ABC transporter permease [Aurantimonas sp. 22II-16-19i]ORE97955.1 inner-membrane translocator [Aurantimonas sp. 22II-16-19i]